MLQKNDIGIKIKIYLALCLLFFLQACQTESEKKPASVDQDEEIEETIDTPQIAPNGTIVFGWTGTINRKIPVFMNFWYEGNNVLGEIIYQDSKEKMPISIYGTIADDGELRLLEFEKTGNITGVIKTIPTEDALYGTWFSPQTRKEFQIALQRRESTKKLRNSKASIPEIAGRYGYQYGPNGAAGTLEVKSVKGNQIQFELVGLTGGNSPNIATVENAVSTLNENTVIYKIPGSENCEFKIEFFKTFASVRYTQGHCNGQFGMNATIEGIYLKLD